MKYCTGLFQPYLMKKLAIKNRFMRSAMMTNMADRDGFITEDNLNLYRRAAEGGVGLLITEAVAVHPEGSPMPGQIAAWDDNYIPGLKRLADAVHSHGDGAVIMPQLQCGVPKEWSASAGRTLIAQGIDLVDDKLAESLIKAFADAALRMKEAGFDGIELHGCHGYLIAQLLSPALNHTTGKWGGSKENRMRFLLEVYMAVREKVGDDFPVGIKLNTADYLPGGNWVDETSEMAGKFVELGIDFIEMSGGAGFPGELREALRKKAGPREYYFRDAIPSYKEAVKDTKTALAVIGGIRTPRVMEEILNEGVDFISLARPWLCEPDLAKRVKAGDLRPSRCVSREVRCNLCLIRISLGAPLTCEKFYPGDCRMQCPIDQDNPTCFSLVAQAKYQEALEVVKKDNPLANVLSRVCHRPCERICRGETGEPLAIRDLKRFVTDYGLEKGLMLEAKRNVDNGRGKAAIIGSGPAGLTCAFYLAQKGYRPVVFEKLPVKGGMLSVGIPKFRLPEEITNADIRYVESAGVEIRTGLTLGEDFTIKGLMAQGYQAVFMAMGASLGRRLEIEGSDLDGVIPGLDFMKAVHLGNKVEVGKRVLVIGGGNLAVDAAMTALRLGAERAELACLESRDEMPAYENEIDDAEEEGIVAHCCWSPKRIMGEKGKVSGVEFVRCKSVFDEKGHFNPICDEKVDRFIEADTVIIAVGQKPDLSFLEKDSWIKLCEAGLIEVDGRTLETSLPGLFAGGDLVTGAKSVVEAVSAGKIAAESISRYLEGRSLARPSQDDAYDPFLKVVHPSAFADPGERQKAGESVRPDFPKLLPDKRSGNFKEVVGSLKEGQAVQEARRCMKYDLELEEKWQAILAKIGGVDFILEPEKSP